MQMESVPHSKWLRTNMSANRVVSWTVEQSSCIFNVTMCDHCWLLSPQLGDSQWICNASVGFRQIIHTSHAQIVYANIRWWPNNSKSAHICLYRVRFPCIGKPGAIFRAVNSKANVMYHVPGFHQTVVWMTERLALYLFGLVFPVPFIMSRSVEEA